MADIKDQLIKDSYNYVLQSDLSTGVVYRIGGAIPVNPIFSSGLTINDSFVYSGAGEQNGYALLTDGTGYAYWGPMSGASGLTYYVQSTVPPGTGYTNGDRWFDTTTGDETVWINDGVGSGQWVQPNNGGGGGGSPYSGSGVSNFLTIWNSTYGLSASTIQYNGTQYLIPSLSSTTIYSENYQGNVVTDIQNGTYISISQNTGSVTINNDKPDLDVTFTVQDGVTVSGVYPNFDITNTDKGSSQYIFKNIKINGNTQFSSSINNDSLNFSGIGVTITSGSNNTLIFNSSGGSSNLQYFVSGSTPTAIQSGDRWFNTDTAIELVWIDDGNSSQWVQPFSVPGPISPDVGYYLTTGITTSQTITWDKTYWGISGSTNVNITLPSTVSKEGYYLIIKDEAGICGTYRIRLTPTSGTIDGNNYVDMNINYMSLTCMVRGGNWYLI